MLEHLGFRQNFAARHASNVLEDTRTYFIDSLRRINDAAGGKIEVARHPFEYRCVRRQLDYRHNRISDGRAASRREDYDGGSRGNQAWSGFLIVTRALHQMQSAMLWRFGVFNHAFHAGSARLGHRPQALDGDVEQTARDIAGAGILI